MGEDTGYESAFNEAALKMKRIHESQDVINSMSVNLLMHNYVAEKYNYEIVCAELINLFHEVSGKLSDKEKTEGKRWRDLLIITLEVKPIFTLEYQDGLGERKKYNKHNSENWTFLRKIIFEFGDMIREYLEKHGMSAPNQESDGGWD